MADLDTALILKLSADLKRFEGQMKKATQVTGTAAKGMEEKMGGATRKIAQTAEASAEAIGREMDRLRSKYDPVFAASKRYEASLDDLNRAQKIGAIDATTHAAALDRLNAEYAQTAAPAKAATTAIQQTGAAMAQTNAASRLAGGGMLGFMNVSRQGRSVLQNTTAQFGDMAVQLEMGTDPMRVMSQQLPQLFGGLGMLGGTLGIVAPLLGLVAAVGLPLAAMFFTLGGDSEEAAEKVKTFADKLDAAEGALGRAEAAMKAASAGGLDDLREKYGEVTKAVTELADALADIEKRAAVVKLGDVLGDSTISNFTKSFAKAIGGVSAVLVQATEEDIEAQRQIVAQFESEIANRKTMNIPLDPGMMETLTQLREELAALEGNYENIGSLADDVGPDTEVIARVQQLQRAYADAVAAADFTGIADALAMMRDLAQQTGVELDEGVVEAMVQGEDIARQFAARLKDAEGAADGVSAAASDLPNTVGAAANEAARLATNLGSAMAALRGVMAGMQSANRVAANRIAAEQATVGKPVERAGALARVEANEVSGEAAYAAIRSGSSTALNEVKGISDRMVAEAEGLAAENEALKLAEEAFSEAARAAGGGGSKGGGRGGGKKEERSIFDNADKELAAIKERIATLGMSAAATARYTTEQELLNAAREAGLSLDAEDLATGQTLRETIAAKADAVGQVTAEFEQSRISAENYRDRLDSIVDSLADVVIEGKSAGDVLSSAFRQIGRSLFESGLQSLLGGGGGGGGFLGALLGGFGGSPSGSSVANAASGSGGIYAKGAAFQAGRVVPYAKGGAFTNQVVSRPTLAPQALFGEAGPEAIMPLTRGPGGKLGVQSSGGSAQAVHVTVGVSADASGNLMPFVQSVTQQGLSANNAQRDKAFVGKTNATRANTHRRVR